jgi:hypothetical protein
MMKKTSAPDIPDSSSEEPPGRGHPLPPPAPDTKARAFRKDGVAFSMNGTAEAHAVDWSVEIIRDRVMIRSRRLREVFPPSEWTSDWSRDRWYDVDLLRLAAKKFPAVQSLLDETASAIAQLLEYHASMVPSPTTPMCIV